MKGKTVVISGGTSELARSLREHSPKWALVSSSSRGISRERKRHRRGSVEADPVSPTPYILPISHAWPR
jgi:hypothetical protein